MNRELLLVLLALVAVLLFVTIGARFISYLQDAALGKYPADAIVRILGYRLPGFMQLLLPFGWFLALLLTLGRLHAEQEFEVLGGGGVGPLKLLSWVGPSAILTALAVGYLSIFLAPDDDKKLTEFIREQQANVEFNVVSPGIFHIYHAGTRVTYADSVSRDGRSLRDVFMAELKGGKDAVTIRAQAGGQLADPETGTRYLELTNGHRYEGTPGRSDYQIVSFGRLRQRLEDGPRATRLGIEARPSAELVARSDPEARAEMQFRLALPLVVLITTLLAIGIGRIKPRDGRFARLVPGLAVFVAYYAAIVFARNAISDGQLASGFPMWVVHGVFLLGGILAFRRSALPA
ncbi:MAG: LPS export ABC transporter permease LptF [Gammaproteobacteria bacterium]